MDEKTKDHFNKVAKGSEGHSYEEQRWDANARVREQRRAAERFVTTIAAEHLKRGGVMFELGPGPGTWTRVLVKHIPISRLILSDISGEMLRRASNTVQGVEVEIREGDFADLSHLTAEADVFFSSRAFEYLHDKSHSMTAIAALMKPGARGCLITKTPKPVSNILSGRTPSALHQGQISTRECIRIMKEAGLINMRVFPVTLGVPLLRSAAADRALERIFGCSPLSILSSFFSESYGVLFEKPL